MKVANDGALECIGKDGILFRFEKDNYDRHCAKHLYLYNKSSLSKIESTLVDPDTITKGPSSDIKKRGKVRKIWDKRTYYKIIGHGRGGMIYVCKVPLFVSSEKVYIIKTALLSWTPSIWYVNQNETVEWERKGH